MNKPKILWFARPLWEEQLVKWPGLLEDRYDVVQPEVQCLDKFPDVLPELHNCFAAVISDFLPRTAEGAATYAELAPMRLQAYNEWLQLQEVAVEDEHAIDEKRRQIDDLDRQIYGAMELVGGTEALAMIRDHPGSEIEGLGKRIPVVVFPHKFGVQCVGENTIKRVALYDGLVLQDWSTNGTLDIGKVVSHLRSSMRLLDSNAESVVLPDPAVISSGASVAYPGVLSAEPREAAEADLRQRLLYS